MSLKQQFKVTLLEDVIISERAATEGGHGSLDYLPGATFLGAVAARLYDQLTTEDAYTVFHSGKVRFGNALPLNKDGCLTYPIPLCWYTPKGKKTPILNYQYKNIRQHPDNVQPEQKRDGYVSPNYVDSKNIFPEKIIRQLRMKTAINPENGIARDEQLFGYSSLPKGQEFVFNLEAKDSVEQSLFNRVVEVLQSGELLKLGRSRSAEYGAVKIKLLSEPREEREIEWSKKEGVTLLLLSDAALQDNNGQPLLYPTAKSVGLPSDFELKRKKTFIRSRRYAPFNACLCRRELERVVLSMGSVLHFESDNETSVNADKLQSIQKQGIGLYRQTGLGRVWVNPKWVAKHEPSFTKIPPKAVRQFIERSRRPPVPAHLDTYAYLDNRMRQDDYANQVEKAIKDENKQIDWLSELESLYQSANLLPQNLQDIWIGPSPSQWGRVMEIVNTTTDDTLMVLFFGEDAVCKENDSQWSKQIFYEPEKEIDDFRKWLMYKICREKNQALLPKIVGRFARLARDVAINKARRK